MNPNLDQQLAEAQAAYEAGDITWRQFREIRGRIEQERYKQSRGGQRVRGLWNPRRAEKPYDPRDFQLAAQTQAIYENLVLQATGRKNFRWRGKRADLQLNPDQVRNLLSRAFAIATASEKRAPKPKRVKGTPFKVGQSPWLKPFGRVPTARTARASKARYAGDYVGSDGKKRTLQDLVFTRQSYEETLGLARKSGFYRVVPEPTKNGLRYFIWPMPPGCYDPGPATSSLQEAQAIAADLERRSTPGSWRPADVRYTKRKLSSWLPPASAFEAGATKATKKRKPRKKRKTG